MKICMISIGKITNIKIDITTHRNIIGLEYSNITFSHKIQHKGKER